MRPSIGILLAVLLTAPPAAAQDAPIVSLAPLDPARWDAAGYFGWRGGNKSDIAPAWDQWYDAASFGGSAGYYWTSHLKLDLDLSATGDGEVFVQEEIPFPGSPLPVFRYGEHRFRTLTVSGALLYQFAENTFFHPFIGVGIEAVREHAELEFQDQFPCGRLPCIPGEPRRDATVSYRAMPFVSAGFKWYMTERSFIRSDVRSAFSTGRGVDQVTWRIGIGADF